MPERRKGSKGEMVWILPQRMRWHHWGRLIAGAILLDQWLGPLGSIPSSEAIVVVALGALFAPVPVERRQERKTE